MTIIHEEESGQGKTYAVKFGLGKHLHTRSFATLDEAEAFVGDRIPEADRRRLATAAATAVRRDSERPRHEQRVELMRLAYETCARLREIHLAESSEFDLELRIWHVPAGHSKYNRRRAILLSAKAVSILKALHRARDTSDPRVFPKVGDPNRVSVTFPSLMADMGLGFASFSEFRQSAIDRMVKRSPKLMLQELESIVDSPLRLFDERGLPRSRLLRWHRLDARAPRAAK